MISKLMLRTFLDYDGAKKRIAVLFSSRSCEGNFLQVAAFIDLAAVNMVRMLINRDLYECNM